MNRGRWNPVFLDLSGSGDAVSTWSALCELSPRIVERNNACPDGHACSEAIEGSS